MKAYLVELKTGEKFELAKERILIGRVGAGVDIAVNDNYVGRCHCSLFWENGSWHVVDMNSKNFTYINKRQLKPSVKYPLNYGDELRLAHVSYRLEQRSTADEHDIFISYKNSDRNGSQTRDSQMAEDLYHALKRKGFNPFFSKYSIDASARAEYIDVIDRALESATILVAVGTSRENLSSKWVKSEINQFRSLMNAESDQTRSIITYRSKGLLPNDLPTGIRQFQSYDDLNAAVRFISLCLKKASGFRKEGSKTVLTYEDVIKTDTPYIQKHSRLQIGDTLCNRFQILHKVGEGGTSRVYLAYDNRIGKSVAVKEYVKGKTDIVSKAMRTEIELLKHLNHPAIPQIYDVAESGDSLILVMEYVEGRSLDKVLSERVSFPEERVLEFARQLADVLDYLHNRPTPIIYRDMKPGNLILKPDGTLMLIDFGTARQYIKSATSDTVSLGTIGYAAPEQFGGMGQTDPRTDIYGLGVTLYHLLTGKNPSLPPYEILPIRTINPNLSRKLEAVIKKCTQISPEKRYQSAKELLHAIEKTSKPGILSRLTSFIKYPHSAGAAPSSLRPQSRKTNEPSNLESMETVATRWQMVPTSVLAAEGIYPTLLEENKERNLNIPTRSNMVKTSDGEISETVGKLLAMDAQSRKLIRELIDRLSN